MQYWLIIQRIENWQIDQADGFAMFGLSKRYRKTAEQIVKGDMVICYVSSRISCFVDIRVVRSSALNHLHRIDADGNNLQFQIPTSSIIALPKSSWISIRLVLNDLDLTKEKVGWASIFQSSIRLLTQHDGRYLQTLIEGRVQAT